MPDRRRSIGVPGGRGSGPAAALAVAPSMAAGLSVVPGPGAADDVCDQVLAGGDPGAGRRAGSPTFALVFATKDHVRDMGEIARILARRLGAGCTVGSTTQAPIGGTVEREDGPGLAILTGWLPGVSCVGFSAADLPLVYSASASIALPPNEPSRDVGDEGDRARLRAAAGMGADHRVTFLFADPFCASLPTLLPALAACRPAAPGDGRRGPIIGGVASASSRPRGNALLLDDQVLESGVVGLTVRGDIRVDALVSQGCRAIGPTMVITAGRGNVIKQLGGKPALRMLNDCISALGEAERTHLRNGVFVGRVVDEYRERFGRDDFLIRGVAGVSKESGEIAINDHVRVGQTVQFHVRDARTASEDLAMLLDKQRLHAPPIGALLVTCNGRGKRMFAQHSHDAAALARLFDPADAPPGESRAVPGQPIVPLPRDGPIVPIAGMFASGEIGPVGHEVHMHGFTASAALFRATIATP